jgi:long-chain acyl-CoA synthetase
MALAAQAKISGAGDEIALMDERTTLTWAALDPLLNRIVNGLLAAQLGEARVGVMAMNCAEAMLVHLAGLHAGVSTVPISFHLTASEVAHILADASCRLLFVDAKTAAAGIEAARSAGVEMVVGFRVRRAEGFTDWQEWISRWPETEPAHDMPPRPHLHYTSGTTGTPKGVETPPASFPLKASVAEQIAYFQSLEIVQPHMSPGLVVSPLYHTGPMGSVRALTGGQAQIVLGKFDPETVLKTIDRYRIKTSVMVPTHFQRLLALPKEIRARYDVSSIVKLSHTGAACPPEVKQQMINWFGPVLWDSYGSTESGTTNTISSPEWLKKPGSVGRTVAPFEALIIDDDDKLAGPGASGRIFFRDTSGRGVVYHNDPEKTRAAHIAPGVFTLGDIGHVDEDGYLFITDRSSDMIVSGGVNIYPAEAEQALLKHPAVADVAVLGVPNSDMGEEAKALVIAAYGMAVPASEDLDRFCREHIAGFKCPRSYEFVEDLGRNTMGKINKRALRRRFWPSERTIGG